jgi:hypothetical protein
MFLSASNTHKGPPVGARAGALARPPSVAAPPRHAAHALGKTCLGRAARVARAPLRASPPPAARRGALTHAPRRAARRAARSR